MTVETALSYWFVILLVIAGAELLDGEDRRRAARRRWPANLALVAISAGLAATVPVSNLVAAHWSKTESVGLIYVLNLPFVIAFPIGMTILSLSNYLMHLASHKIPLLWRFHKIHHSDAVLDVTTTYRTHPVLYVVTLLVTAAVVIGFGVPPSAVVFYAVVVFVIDLSHHSAFRIPERMDRALRPFLMTPSLHHIHHSDYVAETDTNYGHDLAIWDRIFRTYLAEPKRSVARFRYGLKQFPPERADDLNALLVAPFKGGPNS